MALGEVLVPECCRWLSFCTLAGEVQLHLRCELSQAQAAVLALYKPCARFTTGTA
jgi:hypothetical protein